MSKFAFAGYPSAIIYETPEGKKALNEVLWGDYIELSGKKKGTRVEARSRGLFETADPLTKKSEKKFGWIEETQIQQNRLLEVIFIDIGQGDGCLVVTPGDKHILIDAGQGDNLYRFLRWRYNKFRAPLNKNGKPHFESIVISHSDADHYNGFNLLFDEKDNQGNNLKNLTVGTIYHNGIVERAGKDTLGPKKDGFLTDIIIDKEAMEKLLSKPSNITDPKTRRSKQYPSLLKKALDSGRVKDIRMLCSEDKYMPGYEAGNDLSIEVAGPFPEINSKGKRMLRWFENVGKTKNGHSVVLRLCYKNVKILLGGDLNIPSEEHLLRKHTKLNIPPKTDEEKRLVLGAGRKVFQVDVAKSCHHGSADFTELFLQAVNPIATVVSSGDDEPHAHPRADTLGTLGKFSRGARSLIFSTELSRSAKETIKHPNVIKQEFKNADALVEEARKQLNDAQTESDARTESAKKSAKKKAKKKLEMMIKKRDKLREVLARSIAVYGAINVRTDGEKIVIAYRLERSKPGKKWDVYELKPVSGELTYVSKH